MSQVAREREKDMETTTKIVKTFAIEREPNGSGGRRFSQEDATGNRPEKYYVTQDDSRALGDPSRVRITIEAIS
jgi:hypothetical protein